MLGKNVTLLGGTGFVGRAVLNALSKAGYRTTVLVRRPERHRDLLLFPNTRVIACASYQDTLSLAKHFEGRDIVINLTADRLTASEQVPVNELVAANQGIKKAIEASASVKRVLSLSQIGADATQMSDTWLQTLGEVEALMLTLANADSTILQAGLIIGQEDDTTSRYQAQLKLWPILPVAKGGLTVQPIWIKDFAQALVHSLTHASQQPRIAIAGEERLTLKALGETVAEVMGKTDAMVFTMCGLNAKIMAKLGRFAPVRSVSATQLLTLNQDLITDQDFSTQFGFEPACLEHALSTYIVPHSLRARYNFLRREAGRDASDLALIDLEDPLKIP